MPTRAPSPSSMLRRVASPRWARRGSSSAPKKIDLTELKAAFMNLSKEQRAEFSEFAVEVVKDDKRPPIPPAFFDDLDASAHARIMSYLIPCDMGNLACVCKSTRDSLTGAIIFRAEHQELSLDGPTLDRLYWSELRSIGNGEAYGMRPGDRLRLQQLTSAEIAFELRKERAWLNWGGVARSTEGERDRQLVARRDHQLVARQDHQNLGRSLLRLPPGGRTPPFIVFYDFYLFFY